LNLFFSKSHRKYRQDNNGQAGGSLGEERMCGNEDLSVFLALSYSVLPARELKLP
jgi:hypothetical protein